MGASVLSMLSSRSLRRWSGDGAAAYLAEGMLVAFLHNGHFPFLSAKPLQTKMICEKRSWILNQPNKKKKTTNLQLLLINLSD